MDEVGGHDCFKLTTARRWSLNARWMNPSC
jgi:hypothetical protein